MSYLRGWRALLTIHIILLVTLFLINNIFKIALSLIITFYFILDHQWFTKMYFCRGFSSIFSNPHSQHLFFFLRDRLYFGRGTATIFVVFTNRNKLLESTDFWEDYWRRFIWDTNPNYVHTHARSLWRHWREISGPHLPCLGVIYSTDDSCS